MAKLKTERAKKAARFVQEYANELTDPAAFLDDVTHLIRAVQEDTELALMRGKVEFLGEPYMLYRALEDCVGMERRPIHRAAKIAVIRKSLNHYLGLNYNPDRKKRKRRKLLSHV